MADILRVHDWSYVRSIQHLCASIPDVPSVVGHLDADTAISHGTFRAAQVAVGGICRAVDQVVSGQVRDCFVLQIQRQTKKCLKRAFLNKCAYDIGCSCFSCATRPGRRHNSAV